MNLHCIQKKRKERKRERFVKYVGKLSIVNIYYGSKIDKYYYTRLKQDPTKEIKFGIKPFPTDNYL